MSHDHDIHLSDPLDREYNVIGVFEGNDVILNVPIEHSKWINGGFNLTIYEENTANTMVSVPITSDPQEIEIDNFDYDMTRCRLVVEDRTDPDNFIDEQAIGFIIFTRFEAGQVILQQLGFASVLQPDGSYLAIPHFQTEYGDGPDVLGYVEVEDEAGDIYSVPYYDEPTNLFTLPT